MRFLAGVDIGGTFTDVVVTTTRGTTVTAKSPSTPPEFEHGIIAALEAAAEQFDLSLEDLCESLDQISHGTTVGTNALIQMKGARVGLLTTRGHEDCLHIMRGSRGLTGRVIRKVTHFSEGPKPAPIVPKRNVRGIDERVDSSGAVVAQLDEAGAIAAIDALVESGVEAIAICLLWSFLRPDHERRLAEIVAERHPEIFVSASIDLVPKWGEYERMTATVLNAYIGPITTRYLRRIDAKLTEMGYSGQLQITQCGGGTISVERALAAPLLTLDSGPVSGVTGSAFLGAAMGLPNVITTDMGGTSFDVGLVRDGVPAASYKANVNQYEYLLPKVDIQVIGAGGGSLATVDETTRTLRVGPDSAGSRPGPVCYGRGGTVPTVTDAAVVLGYLDPEAFAGGRLALDRDAALAALAELGAKLDMTAEECAAGICRIAEFNMADTIRRTTVEKGYDPRDFTIFAFGGAGPLHAGQFAREAGAARLLIPQRRTASVWCAFGAAAADVLHVVERAAPMTSPFDAAKISDAMGQAADAARDLMARELRSDVSLGFSVDMRHRGQINEVEVALPAERLDEQAIDGMVEDFFDRYEALFGRGSAFAGATLEIVAVRCRALSETARPAVSQADMSQEAPAPLRERKVYWTELKARRATPIYDGDAMRPGGRVEGPAIVETRDTTVVVHDGQSLSADAWGNFEMTL